VKVSEITGLRVDPRGEIDFDEAERDRYVSRFLAAFDADVEEDAKAQLVHEIHLEVRSNYDLYIAINNALSTRHRSALRTYVLQWKSRS
jgi:hypothetical protein